jgi:predicted dehydrogenase
MTKLKVGVIGTGMAFERLHYPAFQKLAGHYEIAALCDVDPEKAGKWAQRLNLNQNCVYTDYQDMLSRDDLDVIDIMVPIELNYKVTEDVARRLAGSRKGIICEKPLAPDMSQARAARDLARKYNLPIMIAENFRYSEEYNLIRDLVRTNRIGDVYYFIQNHVVDFPAEMPGDKFAAREWRQHPEFPGGVITDTAVHYLAGLRHIFGAIDQLQAFGRPQQADFSPYAAVNVNMLFKNGVTGQFSFCCAAKEMQRPLIGLRIFGTRGMIYLEESNAGTINLAFNDGSSEQIPYEVAKGYYNELLNFHKALTGIEPVSVPPEMEYGDLKAVLSILKSIEEKRIISIDEEASYNPSYNPYNQIEQAEYMH